MFENATPKNEELVRVHINRNKTPEDYELEENPQK